MDINTTNSINENPTAEAVETPVTTTTPVVEEIKVEETTPVVEPEVVTPVEAVKPVEAVETEATPTEDVVIKKTSNFDIDEDDLALLEDEEIEDKVEEEAKKKRLEEFKAEFNKSFTPVKEKVNLSEFTISKKAVGISKVINHIHTYESSTACSVLYNNNRVVKMTGLSSLELNRMDPSKIRQDNYLSFMVQKFRTIYDHIVDPNKPTTFEAWMKLNNTGSVNDYFFAGYKATFADSNILTYSCPKCDNAFLEKFDVDSMIKFKDDNAKKKYYDILHSGDISSRQETITNGLFQVTDEYVFELRTPTLYSTYLEPTMLDEKIATKYDDLLTLISYVENAYVIDKKEKCLRPIDMKPDAASPSNTIKRKVKALAIIIKSFTSDQLQAFSTETNKYDNEQYDEDGNIVKSDISYIIPACDCPKCGNHIEEQDQLPENMLFLRHQLGAYTRM